MSRSLVTAVALVALTATGAGAKYKDYSDTLHRIVTAWRRGGRQTIIAVVAASGLVTMAEAQSQGPNSPAAVVNDASFGTLPWALPANAAVSDNMSAAVAPLSSLCGDNQIGLSEECDDGNTANGDCCSSTCQFDARSTPCQDDGDPCNGDETCDGAGTCLSVVGPPPGCRTPGKGLLLYKDNPNDAKDTLVWKWVKGQSTTFAELGSATGTTAYTLCLYAGPAALGDATIAAGSGNWTAIGASNGYKYKDTRATSDGITKAILKSSASNKAKALVKGKGTNLPDIATPFAPPVTVQLHNDANTVCFTTTLATIKKNVVGQFKGHTASGSDDPSPEPIHVNPIHVMFVIHFDPLSTDGSGNVSQAHYAQNRDNLQWLSDYFDGIEASKGPAYVPHLVLEIAGDHAEYYSEDPAGLALMQHLYQKGHTFGVHFHENVKRGAHKWVKVAGTAAEKTEGTSDHIAEVDKLVGLVIDTTDPVAIRAKNYTLQGHQALLDRALAEAEGFYVTTSAEKLNDYFDHPPYNPNRPTGLSGAGLLDENLAGHWILLPGDPVLGELVKHVSWVNMSIPGMQRKFYHIYLEWKNRERDALSADNRVWVFQWHEHTINIGFDDGQWGGPTPSQNYRDEVVEFITWLNETWINTQTADGTLIARYSNVDTVVAEFNTWEADHPGESSFNYTATVQDWNQYPYRLQGLTRELIGAMYEEDMPIFDAQGGHVVRLTRGLPRDSWTYDAAGNLAPTATRADTDTIYMIWSDEGAKVGDFSSVLTGDVTVIDGESGAASTVPATSVAYSEIPIICLGASAPANLSLNPGS